MANATATALAPAKPATGPAVSQIQLVNAVNLGGAYESAFYATRGAAFTEDAIGVTVTTPRGSARIPWGNIKAAHYVVADG